MGVFNLSHNPRVPAPSRAQTLRSAIVADCPPGNPIWQLAQERHLGVPSSQSLRCPSTCKSSSSWGQGEAHHLPVSWHCPCHCPPKGYSWPEGGACQAEHPALHLTAGQAVTWERPCSCSPAQPSPQGGMAESHDLAARQAGVPAQPGSIPAMGHRVTLPFQTSVSAFMTWGGNDPFLDSAGFVFSM